MANGLSLSNLGLFGLDLLLLGCQLAFRLGASLVVVGQVASLTHAHRVQLPVGVRALGGQLVPAVLPIAGRAHVLGVVLPVGVRTLGDLHGSLRSRGQQVLQIGYVLRLSILRFQLCGSRDTLDRVFVLEVAGH